MKSTTCIIAGIFVIGLNVTAEEPNRVFHCMDPAGEPVALIREFNDRAELHYPDHSVQTYSRIVKHSSRSGDLTYVSKLNDVVLRIPKYTDVVKGIYWLTLHSTHDSLMECEVLK